jgi:Uma2 family endonuclease
MTANAPEVLLRFPRIGEEVTISIPRFYLPDDRAFLEMCRNNAHSGLWFEREANGEVRFMPPSGSETGRINGFILLRLGSWNEEQGEPGYVFDSSAGFRLPNGAVRAPDVAFVKKERYEAIPPEQRENHAPIAPDFLVEVMSPSDRLSDLKAKMKEYVANGVGLGWLIYRKKRTVYVYRPGQAAQELTDVDAVAADPELPGFLLPLDRLF